MKGVVADLGRGTKAASGEGGQRASLGVEHRVADHPDAWR